MAQMVAAWRHVWSTSPLSGTSKMFPFGIVSLAGGTFCSSIRLFYFVSEPCINLHSAPESGLNILGKIGAQRQFPALPIMRSPRVRLGVNYPCFTTHHTSVLLRDPFVAQVPVKDIAMPCLRFATLRPLVEPLSRVSLVPLPPPSVCVSLTSTIWASRTAGGGLLPNRMIPNAFVAQAFDAGEPAGEAPTPLNESFYLSTQLHGHSIQKIIPSTWVSVSHSMSNEHCPTTMTSSSHN